MTKKNLKPVNIVGIKNGGTYSYSSYYAIYCTT